MNENASEWWEEDDDCYEGDFDAYLGDCSWEYSMISKEDYEKIKPIWFQVGFIDFYKKIYYNIYIK